LWLGAVLVVGFLGWYRSINVVFLIAYYMVCLLAFNGILALVNVRRVKVQRESFVPIHAGEEANVRIRVENISSNSATVIVYDRVAGKSEGWLVPNLPRKASVICQARRVLSNRGRFITNTRVSSGYPIGLISITLPVMTSEITVLPAVGYIDPDGLRRWVQLQAGINDRGRKVLRRLTNEAMDGRGVRPYRPGDPMRTIHWRLSARRGEPVVREYDAASNPDLFLVVEPWLPDNPTSKQRASLEGALSLAATIASSWGRVYGSQVTLVVAGDSTSLRISTRDDEAIREALTPLATVEGSQEFGPLNAGIFTRSLARSARILVSSQPNSPSAMQLTRDTGRLFLAISPADWLPWYLPPVSLKHHQKDQSHRT
jgi:uncharacterized protein (DUF58 family)